MVRSLRWVVCWVAVTATLSGCSTTCCNWWGRNSDCSPCFGKKPEATTQPGPLAGTYQRPGNGNTVSPLMPGTSGAPVVTSTPAVSYQGTLNAPGTTAPGLPVPPGPLNQSITPSNYQPGGNAMSPPGLPTAEINPAPEVKITTPTVATPMVQPPSMNLSGGLPVPGNPAMTGPGAAPVNPSGPGTPPMPFVLGPSSPAPAAVPPTVPVPPPQVGNIPEVKMPSFNQANSISPPPIPPPPNVPTLDKN